MDIAATLARIESKLDLIIEALVETAEEDLPDTNCTTLDGEHMQFGERDQSQSL